MKILFLAPQPFFQERGTPIAVRLAAQVLASRSGDTIDLLTYHEGLDVQIPCVELHRIPAIPGIKNIGPGISLKKLICDFVFLCRALKMVWNRRSDQYDLVHAVEESVFIAWILKLLFGIPYIYDMDSSLAMQVTEKWWLLRPLYPLLYLFEKLAVKFSVAVVPVCDALAVIADKHGSSDTLILRDISLLDLEAAKTSKVNLKKEIGHPDTGDLLAVYIGNLEHYQGIDLLLESFAAIKDQFSASRIVIIGGTEAHIALYKDKAKKLGIDHRVHLVGPRPVSKLSEYLLEADILLSPRVKGNNTPMKVYSYLHSGVPVVATRLPTHTQVLNDDVSVLCAPEPASFGKGLLSVFESKNLRLELGKAARELAEREYTFEVFSRRLNKLYDRLGEKLNPEEGSADHAVNS